LCADNSGFTPLTEALARRYGSQRGPEEIIAHMNRVYDTLIAEVDNFGGSVIGFSGDAITCWFQDDPSDGSAGRGALSAAPRAITCGLAMQRALHQFATGLSSGPEAAPVNVKVAITTGPVRRFRVGDPTIRYMDVIAGATLDRLAITEHNAQQGRVVVDAETASHAGSSGNSKKNRQVNLWALPKTSSQPGAGNQGSNSTPKRGNRPRLLCMLSTPTNCRGELVC
jgi:class 3 adenylate cyclase